ncbi:retrovirus-related Pol polyprotein from transposon 17.6 [Trichonephila clavipes]|nr:retrovirus-related Pol polyprotein from transposon 17.6 [Trichonephila clavipes]
MEITSTRVICEEFLASGEQVVLLIPDSSNKIYARWTGPGEIIQHHPPHSYKVKLPDGTVRHVHVNKIRKYHLRALAVGVIFEGDHEFGEIHPTLIYRGPHLKEFYMKSNLNHLKESEREQVLAIVLKHQTLFTSDVKIAKWITEGRVYRRGGSGRPRNTNDREDRAIRRVATSAPTTSLASIQRHLPPSRHPVPSRETIRRRLTEVGLRSRRPLRRLPLTPHHRQCRLDFADLGQLGV